MHTPTAIHAPTECSNHWKASALALVILSAWFCAPPRAAASPEPPAGSPEPPAWPLPWEWDAGAFASHLESIDGADRTRAAGPFYEHTTAPDGTELFAPVRPFWSRAIDPVGGRTNWDACWPVAAGKTFGDERSWRVANVFGFDKDASDSTSKADHLWVLPVWASGQTAEGQSYAALFPFGGTVRDFLWKDRISFVLWPIWMESDVNDLHTTDILWPIYSRGRSDDGKWDKLRVFPFYSRIENKRQFVKKSVMWPFWNQAEYTHPKANGKAWVLFPVCGRVDLNSQKGWMALPPLFQYVEGEQMTRLYCPWPFFQRETGKYRQRLYVWPFWGTRTDGDLRRTFWAWPFLIREQNRVGREQRVRWTLVPFWNRVTTSVPVGDPPPEPKRGSLFSAIAPGSGDGDGDSADAPPPPPADDGPRRITATRTKVWPLWSHASNVDTGEIRWRTLELWPGPNPAPVERSWAPLWTLADYRAKEGRSELDVLWGLYRQRCEADGSRSFSAFPLWDHDRSEPRGERHWSFLKGLLAWDRTPGERRLRFLWIGSWTFDAPAAEEAQALEN